MFAVDVHSGPDVVARRAKALEPLVDSSGREGLDRGARRAMASEVSQKLVTP